jgi:hypothetical protein
MSVHSHDFLREPRPLIERVAVAGDDLTAMPTYVRQRAEGSSLGSKMKSG